MAEIDVLEGLGDGTVHDNGGVGVEGVFDPDGGDAVILPRVEGGSAPVVVVPAGVGALDSSVEADTAVAETAFATVASIVASSALVAAPFPVVDAVADASAAPAADVDGPPLPPR